MAEEAKRFACVRILTVELLASGEGTWGHSRLLNHTEEEAVLNSEEWAGGVSSMSIAISSLVPTTTLPETCRGNEEMVLKPAERLPHYRNIRLARVRGRAGLLSLIGRFMVASLLDHGEFAHNPRPHEFIILFGALRELFTSG